MPSINAIATARNVLSHFKNSDTVDHVRAEIRLQLMEHYSTPIENAPFRKSTIRNLLKMGVRYVGELFYLSHYGVELRSKLLEPDGADPLAEG